jgi:hypothetical protein
MTRETMREKWGLTILSQGGLSPFFAPSTELPGSDSLVTLIFFVSSYQRSSAFISGQYFFYPEARP